MRRTGSKPLPPATSLPGTGSEYDVERRAVVRAFLGSLASLSAAGALSACGNSDTNGQTLGGGSPVEPPPAQPPTPRAVTPPVAAPPPVASPPPAASPAPLPPAPPVIANIDWGSGSDTGSITGDVWTPGRDGQGRVNRASWESVPRGRWIEAAGTRIDTGLTSTLVNAGLGWTTSEQLWGSHPGANLFQSWSGFAVDQGAGRLFFLGGGHSDGYNNGLYRFDCNRMAWAVECMPSNRTQMGSVYLANGSATNNPESTAVALANFNANNPVGTTTGVITPVLNGPFYDEIPFDAKPTARHTYQGMVYVPDIGSAGSVFMGVRRLWRYDLAAGRWVSRRLVNDVVRAQGSGAPNARGVYEIHAAEASFTAYDEVRRRVLVSASGSAGAGAFAFDLQSEAWAAWSGSYGLNYNHAAQARVGRKLVALNPPVSDQAVSVGRYWVHDLDTGSTVAANLQFSGGLSLADFPSAGSFYDGAAMVYVPPLNRFWLVTRRGAGGMFWIEIDPTTTPWTASPLSFANASPIEQRLPIGRVQWIEGLRAVLAWDHCFTGAKFYRF